MGDGTDGSIGTDVVRAVAEVRGTDVEELPPLDDSLDPDALEALFDSAADDSLHVTFAYAGRSVTVRAGGEVVVGPPTPDETA